MKIRLENNFIRGAVAGSISAVVICMFTEVCEIVGIAKHCWLFMAGQAVMQFNHSDAWKVAFSFLVHLGVGAFWGVVIAFLLSKVFTYRHYIFKGALIGLAIFFLHLGLLSKVLHYPEAMRQETLTNFLILVSYLIYGILVCFLLRKLPGKDPVSW